MRMIGMLGGVIASAVLAGCGGTFGTMGGGPTPPATTYKCTLNDDCVVTVTVVPDGATSCMITIDPMPDLEMKSGGLSAAVSHLIRWVLDDDSQDAKFRFAESPPGVAFKSTSPNPEGQFFKQARKYGGREYQWRDNNSDRQYYDYTINIIQKNSNPPRACAKDPRIWNN